MWELCKFELPEKHLTSSVVYLESTVPKRKMRGCTTKLSLSTSGDLPMIRRKVLFVYSLYGILYSMTLYSIPLYVVWYFVNGASEDEGLVMTRIQPCLIWFDPAITLERTCSTRHSISPVVSPGLVRGHLLFSSFLSRLLLFFPWFFSSASPLSLFDFSPSHHCCLTYTQLSGKALLPLRPTYMNTIANSYHGLVHYRCHHVYWTAWTHQSWFSRRRLGYISPGWETSHYKDRT